MGVTTATPGEQILDGILKAVESRARVWPCHTNRASELPHPCHRYLVYLRTEWQRRELPPPDLQTIFEEGNLHEEAVLQSLREAGFNVIEQQVALNYPEHKITGHIDASIVMNGRAVPVEIKSMHPFIWQTINSVEDLQEARKIWLRKYVGQMQLYLLLKGEERGVMLLKNKATGALKALDIDFDAGYCEELIQKADSINAYIEAGNLPDRIPYDPDVCGRCDFTTLCAPEVVGAGTEIVSDEELEAMLNKRGALHPSFKEFQKLDKEIKARLQGIEAGICGSWLIRGEERLRQQKASEAREVRYWKVEISPVKPGESETEDE